MQRPQTKVRPPRCAPPASAAGAQRPARAGYYALLLSLVLLASACNRKLNQRDGRYYSARDMVRLKRGERVGRPAPGRAAVPKATVKVKTKVKVPTRPAPGAAGGGGGSGADAGGSASSGGSLPARPAPRRYVARASTATGIVAAAIEAARGYQGTPYLYGGTTRDGLDCSALLQLSFAEAGVSIPRSSNEQAAWGEPVKPTELQPGDFLFFGATPGSPVITHVGLVTVVDAEGVEFIHASSSLGVIENSFEADYYLSRFIRAVRPRLGGARAGGGAGE